MFIRIVVLLAVVLGIPSICKSQPSLGGPDTKSFSLQGPDRELVVSVRRDARNESQFYYFPPRVTLTSRTIAGRDVPDFALRRFQFDQNGKALEAGWISFTVSPSLPPEALSELEKKVAKAWGIEKIRLDMVPISKARAYFFKAAPNKDTKADEMLSNFIVSSQPGDAGLAPSTLTQDVAFQSFLSKSGADLLDGLATDGGGFPVAITYTYEAFTTELGFTVEVSWENLYKHYSKDRKAGGRATLFGIIKLGGSADATEIYDDLTQSGVIEIKTFDGKALTREQMNVYLQPILARVNADLSKKLEIPPQQTPASASRPGSSGILGLFGLDAGYNEAWKRTERNFRGKETYTFKSRTLTEINSSVTGTIDISDLADDLKKQLVSDIKTQIWESAFVMLPTISNSPELNYSKVTVAASLLKDGKTIGSTRWPNGKSRMDGAAAMEHLTPMLRSCFFQSKVLESKARTWISIQSRSKP